MKTAVAWLEEASLVRREENRVQVFPSSLLIRTIAEAEKALASVDITEARRKALLSLVRYIMTAGPDAGVSTDELCTVSGLSTAGLTKAMADLEALGIARNDMGLTVFVHVAVANASTSRLAAASELERGLLTVMREAAPDVAEDEPCQLHLAEVCQGLRDLGHASARPDVLEKLLRGMARDGRDEDGGKGNVRIRKLTRNTLGVSLSRSWSVLERTRTLRREAADLLLAHLAGKLERGARGNDLQVETTIGELLGALSGDAMLRASGVRDLGKLMQRTLLWLHEQGIVTIGKGLTVFRHAITVHVNPETRRSGFTQDNFRPLEEHYEEQTIQTHVMAAYAEHGLTDMGKALRLSADYFTQDREAFLERWMPGRTSEIRRRTTGASWRAIVDGLGNKAQQEIVADDREQTSVLVLAGPGSGKTRVLVHRIAYLLRVRREDPRGILVLTYNRHAAAEIRARLRHLVGDDAIGVTISTCHALAMRLVGASFTGASAHEDDFDAVLADAVRLLNGDGLSRAEAEAQRDALIQGFRWILVDEYQDVGPEEYALISAVAGRSLDDPDRKLSLFAVGDDDQNIYAFTGASIDYIRRFEDDYRARATYLTQNYRSTHHIVSVSNAVIGGAPDRMKAGRDITVDSARSKAPPGGIMERSDPVAMGRVQLLECPPGEAAHAVAAIDELIRLSRLDPNWRWDRTAIIAREWRRLAPARTYAEALKLPVEMAYEELPSVWRLREMQCLVEALRNEPEAMLTVADILAHINDMQVNRWTDLLAEGAAALARELGTSGMPIAEIIEWLAEWARDVRSEPRGLLLTTAHRAKGLEFDHVVVLDGGWASASRGEDADAPRRLFYVAMTRARQTLAITTSGAHRFISGAERGLLKRRAGVSDGQDQLDAAVYQMPDFKTVDLSFAGRLGDRHEAHAAIAEARTGDRIHLTRQEERWLLRDRQGRLIGRLAKSWSPPIGAKSAHVTVGAVIRWGKADSEPDYRSNLRRDSWETVLPEMRFTSAKG